MSGKRDEVTNEGIERLDAVPLQCYSIVQYLSLFWGYSVTIQMEFDPGDIDRDMIREMTCVDGWIYIELLNFFADFGEKYVDTLQEKLFTS